MAVIATAIVPFLIKMMKNNRKSKSYNLIIDEQLALCNSIWDESVLTDNSENSPKKTKLFVLHNKLLFH